MTPEEILRDLRDIHLPEAAAGAIVGDIVWWPLLLLALLIVVAVAVAWHRRTAWRRELNDRLGQIEQQATAGRIDDAWVAVALLLRQLSLLVLGSEQVAQQTGERWLQTLDALFGGNTFTAGPGRALLVRPYAVASEPAAAGRELASLIRFVRQNMSRIRPA